jgi:hypothetical protein
VSSRLIAPRREWPTLTDAARDLGCCYTALYRYIEARGGRWHLKGLDEDAYARWHQLYWAPAQEQRERSV